MKLNLGCGRHDKQEEYCNVDIAERKNPDEVVNLNETPWPWDDRSVKEIRARHVVEHLDSVVSFMDEAWRVLTPSGRLRITVPHYRHEIAYSDPTHRWFFSPRSMKHFTAIPDNLSPRVWRIESEEFGGGWSFPFWHLNRYLGLDLRPRESYSEITWIMRPEK